MSEIVLSDVWGAVAGSALLIGSAIGNYVHLPRRAIVARFY